MLVDVVYSNQHTLYSYLVTYCTVYIHVLDNVLILHRGTATVSCTMVHAMQRDAQSSYYQQTVEVQSILTNAYLALVIAGVLYSVSSLGLQDHSRPLDPAETRAQALAETLKATKSAYA